MSPPPPDPYRRGMSTPLEAAVVWERTIDRAQQATRWRRLLTWYVAPVAVVAVVFAVALDPWSALGLLILTGLFGLVLVIWVLTINLNERSGAVIRFDGRHLQFRQLRIDTHAVRSYTTYGGEFRGPIPYYSSLLYGTRRPKIDTGNAEFLMSDGTKAEMMWPNMPHDQVDGVRQALDRVLPGKWMPHGSV